MAFIAPFCWLLWNNGGERCFWSLFLAALQAEGPIAVKFAQWASTRPDMLPRNICDHFATLQSAVRPHSLKSTEHILRDAFGADWDQLLRLEPVPVGSGCMAQVYRGQLLPRSTSESAREVAVKVRHPGAQEKVDVDLEVLQSLISALEAVWHGGQYLGLSEALSHFEAFVRPQADLRIEAANLEIFSRNFPYGRTGQGLRVRFPEVLRPFVTETVLVESYEDATPMQTILGQADRAAGGLRGAPLSSSAALRHQLGDKGIGDLREKVGKMCMDIFVKMLFVDNFIHGDLHPGNIHIRMPKDPEGKSEVVLLDAGLAVTLSPADRQNFLETFQALAIKDGTKAGRLIIERSPGDRNLVIDEDAFVVGVENIVTDNFGASGLNLGQVKLGDIFSRMLCLACNHRVKLETSFVKVATSIIVIEGLGRQLDPVTDLASLVRPLLADAVERRIWASAA